MWFILKPEPKPTQTPAQLQLHELQKLHRSKVYQEALIIKKKINFLKPNLNTQEHNKDSKNKRKKKTK